MVTTTTTTTVNNIQIYELSLAVLETEQGPMR
jgi:hypothetical protein